MFKISVIICNKMSCKFRKKNPGWFEGILNKKRLSFSESLFLG
jgi:histidinol phosphatase-like enzyme